MGASRLRDVRVLVLALVAAGAAFTLLGAMEDRAPEWPVVDLTMRHAELVTSVDAGASTPALVLEGRVGPVELLGVVWPDGADARAAAIQYLDNLLRQEEVFVVLAEPQAAGTDRAAGYLFRAPDGLLVNVEMLRQGFAQPADGPHDYARLFRYYGRRAMELRKGVWRPAGASRSLAPLPSAAGAAPAVGEAGSDELIVYVTKSGKKYHREGCSYLTDSARPIALREARTRYSPCSKCKPPT